MPRPVTLFLVALGFYTRLPVPRDLPHDGESLRLSMAALPLVGWLVGGTTAVICYFAMLNLPIMAAVILSMIAGILLTGAFHEDGLADSCDGFGGGWTKDRVLEIMKDSRIGSYGMIGLVMALGLKAVLLTELATEYCLAPLSIALVFMAAHALSRFSALLCPLWGDYARPEGDESAKSGQMHFRLPVPGFVIAAVTAFLPLWALGLLSVSVFWALIPVIAIPWLAQKYFNHRIGGYTGDALGAVQQVTELAIYITFVRVLC